MSTGPLPFPPPDQLLLQALSHHNALVRAALCTLARRGAAMRRDDPARAQAWLDALAVHPYYKGGQFLFDLLEWEDFMLDGEAPPVLDDVQLHAALGRATTMLRSFAAATGERAGPARAAEAAAEAEAGAVALRPSRPDAEPDWPPLAGNAFLFPDVVLGAIEALTTRR